MQRRVYKYLASCRSCPACLPDGRGGGWCAEQDKEIPDPPDKSWVDYFPEFCRLPKEK